jgi:hypothetical protein
VDLGQSVPEEKGAALFASLQLEIAIKTDKPLVLAPYSETMGNLVSDTKTSPSSEESQALLAADLHLQGKADDPRLMGTIDLENQSVDLPAGRFVMPAAKLQIEPTGDIVLKANAYGISQSSLCSLFWDGSVKKSACAFSGSGQIAPDLLLSLATPTRLGGTFSPLVQCYSWIRQKMLFPLPAEEWITSKLGSNDPVALGFYGSPWFCRWSLRQSTPAKQ